MRRLLVPLLIVFVAAACGGTVASPVTSDPAAVESTTPPAVPDGSFAGLTVEEVTTGLSVPVWADSPPDSDRLFVVEQTGTIREIVDGTALETPYLDVSRFITTRGLEQGLLGLAFHPDFAENRRAFVSFTNVNGHTRVMEYLQDLRDPLRLDPGTGRLIFALDQPHQYHNGGMIRFGPDGMLWLALGDGGGIGDRYENGQNPHTLHGTILRLDVDGEPPYQVPPDNPFADGRDGAPEVFAFGFRNPWNFTFVDDDLLFVADVGQETWEEVNVLDLTSDGGNNYGWSIMEGPDCFEADECDRTGLVVPDLDVFHRRTCAIVGGPVYQGTMIPEIAGRYFYGDYCVGWVRSVLWDGAEFVEETDWSEQLGELGQLTTLAEDPDGEILILTHEGTIHRIVAERG